MAWKQGGHPTVQQQRDKWVVRVVGVDTETGRRRPKQVGTYKSRRAAQAAAAAAFTASGEVVTERETVGRLVEEWVAGKVDVSNKTRMQHEWAAGHIHAGIGGLRVDRSVEVAPDAPVGAPGSNPSIASTTERSAPTLVGNFNSSIVLSVSFGQFANATNSDRRTRLSRQRGCRSRLQTKPVIGRTRSR